VSAPAFAPQGVANEKQSQHYSDVMPYKLLSCWNKIFQLLVQPSSDCFAII